MRDQKRGHRLLAATLVCALMMLVSAPLMAQETIQEEGGLFGIGLVVAPKFAVGFGGALGGLGTGFGGELELGWLIPALDRSLQIVFTTRFEQTSEDGEGGPDARLPGSGTFRYEFTRQQLTFSLGMLYRIPVGGQWLRPYVGLGGRNYLWDADITGSSAGQPYGDYREQGTQWGGWGALGVDVFLGPGSAMLELQGDYGPLDSVVFRETNAGALSLFLGYRFFL